MAAATDYDADVEESDVNDDICVVCSGLGFLICCDFCPRAYHLECAHLKKVPHDHWECPQCSSSRRGNQLPYPYIMLGAVEASALGSLADTDVATRIDMSYSQGKKPVPPQHAVVVLDEEKAVTEDIDGATIRSFPAPTAAPPHILSAASNTTTGNREQSGLKRRRVRSRQPKTMANHESKLRRPGDNTDTGYMGDVDSDAAAARKAKKHKASTTAGNGNTSRRHLRAPPRASRSGKSGYTRSTPVISTRTTRGSVHGASVTTPTGSGPTSTRTRAKSKRGGSNDDNIDNNVDVLAKDLDEDIPKQQEEEEDGDAEDDDDDDVDQGDKSEMDHLGHALASTSLKQTKKKASGKRGKGRSGGHRRKKVKTSAVSSSSAATKAIRQKQRIQREREYERLARSSAQARESTHNTRERGTRHNRTKSPKPRRASAGSSRRHRTALASISEAKDESGADESSAGAGGGASGSGSASKAASRKGQRKAVYRTVVTSNSDDSGDPSPQSKKGTKRKKKSVSSTQPRSPSHTAGLIRPTRELLYSRRSSRIAVPVGAPVTMTSWPHHMTVLPRVSTGWVLAAPTAMSSWYYVRLGDDRSTIVRCQQSHFRVRSQ